jgi:hypothetical protein
MKQSSDMHKGSRYTPRTETLLQQEKIILEIMSRGWFVIKRISVFYLHRPISSSSNTLGYEAESEGHYNFFSKTTVRIAAGHDQAT